LFIVFVEEKVCGIENEIQHVDKFLFRKNCMLGNVGFSFFFYNINNKI